MTAVDELANRRAIARKAQFWAYVTSIEGVSPATALEVMRILDRVTRRLSAQLKRARSEEERRDCKRRAAAWMNAQLQTRIQPLVEATVLGPKPGRRRANPKPRLKLVP